MIHTNVRRVLSWELFDLIEAPYQGKNNLHGIRTSEGNYLTAMDSGGRTSDVIHSNATVVQAWEEFLLVGLGGDLVAIQTFDGHFLTAVGEGGRTTDTIHSNASDIKAWEEFHLTCGHQH